MQAREALRTFVYLGWGTTKISGNSYRNQPASTEDFKAVMERHLPRSTASEA
jgi:hypothetical protein